MARPSTPQQNVCPLNRYLGTYCNQFSPQSGPNEDIDAPLPAKWIMPYQRTTQRDQSIIATPKNLKSTLFEINITRQQIER